MCAGAAYPSLALNYETEHSVGPGTSKLTAQGCFPLRVASPDPELALN